MRIIAMWYYMHMAINWVNIYKKYKGKWIALTSDEKTVAAGGNTAKIALNKANKKGLKSPILSFVPTKVLPKVG